MKHRSLALTLVIALGGTLAACNQSPAPTPAPEASPAATPAESPSPAVTDTAAADAAMAAAIPAVAENNALAAQSNGAPLGVPACDDYLQKYEACVSANVPEAARDSLLKSLGASREAWRQVISTPGGAEQLSAACTQAREAAKASMQAYGCTDF